MSISASLASTIFPLCNSSSLTPKHPSATHFTPITRIQLQSNHFLTTFRPFAVPEALEQLPEVEDGETAIGIVGADSDKWSKTDFGCGLGSALVLLILEGKESASGALLIRLNLRLLSEAI
nr:hypothetical protein [Tanacetum cinerariifolium]